jgi:hypothetical protein
MTETSNEKGGSTSPESSPKTMSLSKTSLEDKPLPAAPLVEDSSSTPAPTSATVSSPTKHSSPAQHQQPTSTSQTSPRRTPPTPPTALTSPKPPTSPEPISVASPTTNEPTHGTRQSIDTFSTLVSPTGKGGPLSPSTIPMSMTSTFVPPQAQSPYPLAQRQPSITKYTIPAGYVGSPLGPNSGLGSGLGLNVSGPGNGNLSRRYISGGGGNGIGIGSNIDGLPSSIPNSSSTTYNPIPIHTSGVNVPMYFPSAPQPDLYNSQVNSSITSSDTVSYPPSYPSNLSSSPNMQNASIYLTNVPVFAPVNFNSDPSNTGTGNGFGTVTGFRPGTPGSASGSGQGSPITPSSSKPLLPPTNTSGSGTIPLPAQGLALGVVPSASGPGRNPSVSGAWRNSGNVPFTSLTR